MLKVHPNNTLAVMYFPTLRSYTPPFYFFIYFFHYRSSIVILKKLNHELYKIVKSSAFLQDDTGGDQLRNQGTPNTAHQQASYPSLCGPTFVWRVPATGLVLLWPRLLRMSADSQQPVNICSGDFCYSETVDTTDAAEPRTAGGRGAVFVDQEWCGSHYKRSPSWEILSMRFFRELYVTRLFWESKSWQGLLLFSVRNGFEEFQTTLCQYNLKSHAWLDGLRSHKLYSQIFLRMRRIFDKDRSCFKMTFCCFWVVLKEGFQCIL